eukprot:502109-Pyramimonas_sp.AAC.2
MRPPKEGQDESLPWKPRARGKGARTRPATVAIWLRKRTNRKRAMRRMLNIFEDGAEAQPARMDSERYTVDGRR